MWPSWRPADAEARRWRPRETRCTVAIARLHSPRKVSRSTSQPAAALLEGQEVTLVKDVEETDPYERLLRYVYLGEEMANARVIVSLDHPPWFRACSWHSVPLGKNEIRLSSLSFVRPAQEDLRRRVGQPPQGYDSQLLTTSPGS